jgi:large conductance mechanosensitive channel
MIKEFREFIMRGNVMDLAIGIVIGGTFAKIVTSLVNDILMPPIGLILAGIDFKNLSVTLKSATDTHKAVNLNYGMFINAVIDFVIIAFVIFLVIKVINRLKREKPAVTPSTKPCPQCLETIHIDAKKCKFCASAVGAA